MLAPHWYPPSISKSTTNYMGKGLVNQLTVSSGYLNKQGYCSSGKCHVFAMLVGESGAALQDPRDTQYYATLKNYLENTGEGNDGKHNPIDSVFW